MKNRSHAEDVSWPPKSSDKFLNANKTVASNVDRSLEGAFASSREMVRAA